MARKRDVPRYIRIGDGSFFDANKASCWPEKMMSEDGMRFSAATGRCGEHEELFQTRKGAWVIHAWRDGAFTAVSADEAGTWLIRNGYNPACAGLGYEEARATEDEDEEDDDEDAGYFV